MNNRKPERSIIIKLCPTVKNRRKTNTAFNRLVEANKVTFSKVAPIVDCEFDNIIYSYYFDKKGSYNMCKKLFEQWYYKNNY